MGGNFLQLNSFQEKFNLNCSLREYSKICKAIPAPLKQMIQNSILYSGVSAMLPSLLVGQVQLLDKKCNNKAISNALKSNLFYDYNLNGKIKIVDNVVLENKHCKYLKWPIAPKLKEMQFKIINKVYPAAEMLKKRFNFEVDPCVFCSSEPETIEHLFYSCTITKEFWRDVHSWLKMETCHQFDSMQILVFMDGLPNEVSTMINVIITMGKFLIHKCKWTKCKPTINHFKNDCKVYLESLKVLSKNNLFSLNLFNVMSTHLEM